MQATQQEIKHAQSALYDPASSVYFYFGSEPQSNFDAKMIGYFSLLFLGCQLPHILSFCEKSAIFHFQKVEIYEYSVTLTYPY